MGIDKSSKKVLKILYKRDSLSAPVNNKACSYCSIDFNTADDIILHGPDSAKGNKKGKIYCGFTSVIPYFRLLTKSKIVCQQLNPYRIRLNRYC